MYVCVYFLDEVSFIPGWLQLCYIAKAGVEFPSSCL